MHGPLPIAIPSHLIVHLRDIVEEGKIGVLNPDEIAGYLLEAGLCPDDLSNLLEGLAILGDVLLLLGLLRLLALPLVVLGHVAGESPIITLEKIEKKIIQREIYPTYGR
jgi:hypothetical protein